MKSMLFRILSVAAVVSALTLTTRAAEEQTVEPILQGEGFQIETIPWVHCSWRNKELTITFYATNSTDKEIKFELSPVVTDAKTDKKVMSGKSYKVTLPAGTSEELAFKMPAKGLKTWSHWDPQIYTMDIAVKANGKDAGSFPQVHFGYREMWTENGYFMINGKRVYLRGGNHGGRRNPAEVEGAKYANFNADTARGSLDPKAEAPRVIDIADEAGIYIFYAGGPAPTEEWKKKAGYVHFANHPSVVGFADYHVGYYHGPHGHPMMVGGIVTDEIVEGEKEKNPGAFEYPKEVNEMFPDWVVGHYVRGIGGNFRSLMWDLNYSVPMQSQEEWMKVWAENREKIEPFFPQEFALNRFGADQMRMDRRGGASVLVENTARFFGEESYEMFDESQIPTYTPGTPYPKNMACVSPLYYRMKEYVYDRVAPAWRTWGSGHMLLHVDGHPQHIRKSKPMAEIYRKIFAELYFYMGGSEDDFTNKDHSFYPGEEIKRAGIILNDTETEQTVTVSWEVKDSGGKKIDDGKDKVKAKQGSVNFVPITLKAPEVKTKTSYTITAECKDSNNKSIRTDTFDFRVFPKETVKAEKSFLLVDSTGKTKALFDKAKVNPVVLSCESNDIPSSVKALKDASLLVIGRESYPDAVKILASDEATEALKRGMNIIVLEQMNRYVMGLRVEHTQIRDAFVRDRWSPLMKGLDSKDMSEWRGESSLFPSYPSFDKDSLWFWHGYSYQGQYTSFRQRRGWIWSNKAMVSSLCFEKPQYGNFSIIVDCWYDLMATPLLQFQVGKGRILLCQLDMTDHVGVSPVATILLNRMLSDYASPTDRELLPVGHLTKATGEILADLKMTAQQGITGNAILLTPADLDAVTDAQSKNLAEFVKKGGSLLAQVDTAEQAAKLPAIPELETTTNAVWNPVFADDPVFAGLGISDLFFREGHVYPHVKSFKGADKTSISPSGIAAVASVGKGKVVILQVPATKFKGASKTEFSGRAKVLRIYSSVLTQLAGLSTVAPQLDLISGWGIRYEWMPGFRKRVERGAPKVRRSPLYRKPALDWDPDAHVSF